MILLPEELAIQFAKHSEHYLLKALDGLLEWAFSMNASDLHFESQAATLNVRLRVDGLLHYVLKLPARFGPMVISRLKILAHLDIAEKRLPQDGRFEFNNGTITRVGRISTCPGIFGEKAVIRLLPTEKNWIPLEKQGMTKNQLNVVADLIQAPHGLLIVCGPTGSGKSMTLYGLLEQLNNESRNLISIEDPVEMIVPGVNQIQVQEKSGLDFKNILRNLLRQDPDILMIGEIRDYETAEIAIKAAQTGHLVLSTLHTATSVQAFSRLEQLGLPSYLILEATKMIIAQRLVRQYCPPCQNCIDGFLGRTGIFELLPLSSVKIQEKLLNRQDIKAEDYVDGLDLHAAGREKVIRNITTEAEFKRVV